MSRDYTIKIAISNNDRLHEHELITVLRTGFDRYGDQITGSVSVECIGSSIAVVTYTRDLVRDSGVMGMLDMTLFTQGVAMQLLYEDLTKVWVFSSLEPGHIMRQIIQGLANRDCTVAGLACQQPRLRLVIDLAFKDSGQRDGVERFLSDTVVKALCAEYMPTGEYLNHGVWTDPQPEPALTKSPDEQPTRMVMDLTGGTIQWKIADRPVELLVIDDDNLDGKIIQVTDVDGVQTQASPPTMADLDAEMTNHFFKQLEPKNA